MGDIGTSVFRSKIESLLRQSYQIGEQQGRSKGRGGVVIYGFDDWLMDNSNEVYALVEGKIGDYVVGVITCPNCGESVEISIGVKQEI